MPQAERLFLARVAYLHHVANLPHHSRLFFFSFFFQEALQRGRIVEVIFDGVFAFSGNDDDVLDPRNNALLDDVLNLRLVHNGEHFLGLRLRGGQEARAKPRSRQNRFAHFAWCGTLPLRCVGHSRSSRDLLFLCGFLFFGFYGSGVFRAVALIFARRVGCSGCRLFGIASSGLPRVVGHVPARAFELNGGWRQQTLDSAATVRTFLQVRSVHTFNFLGSPATLLTLVLVQGHRRSSSWCSENEV